MKNETIQITQIRIFEKLETLQEVERVVNQFALENKLIIDYIHVDYLKGYYVIVEYKTTAQFTQLAPPKKIIQSETPTAQKEKAPSNPQKEKKWYE